MPFTPRQGARWLALHGRLAGGGNRPPGGALRAWRRSWLTSRVPPTVLFSQVAWDDVWQRPQELASRLAHGGRPVLFVSPVQLHQVAGPMARRWKPVRIGCGGRLAVVCPLILSGEYRAAAVRAVNRCLVRQSIAPWVRGTRPTFVANTPFCVDLVEGTGAGVVVYDLMDDFCAFSWAPREGRRQEARMLARADGLTVATGALWDAFAGRAREARFVGSGVADVKLRRPAPEPADLRGLPRPRLLYVGTLNDRLDGMLLDRTARAFPGGSVVVVGPRRATFRAPEFPPNVHELGLKPHGELAGYYQHCDVGLMPFADNEAARAINPIKTLEYLAVGLPVISTPVPDVERYYTPPVVVARGGEWPGRIRELLDGASAHEREARRAFARGRSWRRTAAEYEDFLAHLEGGGTAAR